MLAGRYPSQAHRELRARLDNRTIGCHKPCLGIKRHLPTTAMLSSTSINDYYLRPVDY